MPEDGAMPSKVEPVKKYRLGNQSEEYELVTKYLGWLPEGFSSWQDWGQSEDERTSKIDLMERLGEEKPRPLTIFSPDKKESVTLFMNQFIIRDAFPLHFLGEERSKNWWRFFIVTTEENPAEQFIIPLH